MPLGSEGGEGGASLCETRKGIMSRFMLVAVSVTVLALARASFAQSSRGGAAVAQGGNVEAGGTTGAGGQDSLGASGSSSVRTGLRNARSTASSGGSIPATQGADKARQPNDD